MARGKAECTYLYGLSFDIAWSSTFECHIRRTTPIGVFDNATEQECFDLAGNVYTWTSSVYQHPDGSYILSASDGLGREQ